MPELIEPVFWTVAVEAGVRNAIPPGHPMLMLPAAPAIAATGYANDLDGAGPIAGMAVTRIVSHPVILIDDIPPGRRYPAPVDMPCMKVGNRLYILIYEGDMLGNEPHKCPYRDFHKAVLRDLREIAKHDVGVRLLQSIDAHGDGPDAYVYIRYVAGILQRSEADTKGEGKRDSGKLTEGLNGTLVPGAGARKIRVQYNPMLFGVPKMRGFSDRDACLKRGNWGAPDQKPPDVTLFHELVHADDMLQGILEELQVFNRGNSPDIVKLSEARCVGFDGFAPAGLYSENSYREARGFALRDYYSDPRESKNAGNRGVEAAELRLLGYVRSLAAGRRPVAILMTMEHFRWVTSHVGGRDKILAVEDALTTYNTVDALNEDPVARIEGLIRVIAACHAYKRRPKAKRNISALMEAAGAKVLEIVKALCAAMPHPPDEAYFRTLRRVAGILEGGMYNVTGPGAQPPYGDTDGEDGRRKLGAAYDLLYRSGGGKLPGMQRPEVVLRVPPDENDLLSVPRVQAMQREDFDALLAMCMDPQVPTVLIAVIDEMVNLAGPRQNVERGDSRSGSSAGPTPTGHFVKWPQWNADDLRLPTLIHELTHVSTHRSFDNTPVMFSFPAAADAARIAEIQQARTRTIREMMAMVVDADFTGYQRHWLVEVNGQHKGKLAYALADGTMQVSGCLAPPAPRDQFGQPGLQPAPHPTWTTVWRGFGPVSQILWEYDTVINQCLLYMHMWRIPQDNALYTRLRTVAQELFDARAQARALQAQALVPPPVAIPLVPPPRQDVQFFQAVQPPQPQIP